MLDGLKSHSKTVGLKQTMRALEADEVKMVYIAQDADQSLTSKVIDLCNNKKVEVYNVENMKTLGKNCGIDVGTAVAAILKD
ncbi:MAG: 50S ribosomal protein L7ae-like protein [Clostridiaceae bacterium]|nr:50S ribosomal protein L7ae-like protein [Clostridiaceae bacterium]